MVFWGVIGGTVSGVRAVISLLVAWQLHVDGNASVKEIITTTATCCFDTLCTDKTGNM